MLSIKYDLLGKPLELKKKHDFCASKSPELTVVMLHGLASDSRAYAHALKYLEGTTALKNVRFVTFDLLGSGASYKNNKLNYDYNDQLTAFGNSFGRALAWYFYCDAICRHTQKSREEINFGFTTDLYGERFRQSSV